MDNMIGTRIKERRKVLNLTPANIKDLTHIGTGHLSELETGKKLPSTPTLIKLSEVLDCSIDWILFGKTSICESSNSELSSLESELILHFRELTLDNQEEVLEFINMKLRRAKRKEKSPGLDQDSHSATA